jgi:hypothetical protein
MDSVYGGGHGEQYHQCVRCTHWEYRKDVSLQTV